MCVCVLPLSAWSNTLFSPHRVQAVNKSVITGAAIRWVNGGTISGGDDGWRDTKRRRTRMGGGRKEQITVVNWAPNDSAAAAPDAGRRVSN